MLMTKTMVDLWDPFGGIFDGYSLSNCYTETSNNEVVISVVAPGLSKKDFVVSLAGNELSIEYDASKSKIKSIKNRLFKKKWELLEDIERENVKASYEDGVLRVVLPFVHNRDSRNKPVNIAVT